MRLLRQISDLEKRHAERGREAERRARARSIGIAWTSAAKLLPVDVALGPDEHLAMDIYITGYIGKGTAAEMKQWRTEERVSRELGDLGKVYGEDGAIVGHVRMIEGPYVEWEKVESEAATPLPAVRRRRAAPRGSARGGAAAPGDPA